MAPLVALATAALPKLIDLFAGKEPATTFP